MHTWMYNVEYRWEGVAGQKNYPDGNTQIRVQNTLEINVSRFCGASMTLRHETKSIFMRSMTTCGIENGYDHWMKKSKKLMK